MSVFKCGLLLELHWAAAAPAEQAAGSRFHINVTQYSKGDSCATRWSVGTFSFVFCDKFMKRTVLYDAK